MLYNLHVKNLALIKEQEIEFSKGLNILTGETGAGKSVIIGSVNLALGGKADPSLIRTGEEYALVELTFGELEDLQKDLLKEMDIPLEDDGTLVIQRKIMPGSVFCAIGMLVVTMGYAGYTAHAVNNNLLYGSMASLAVLMFWFYFISWVMVLGILVNKVWDDTRQ